MEVNPTQVLFTSTELKCFGRNNGNSKHQDIPNGSVTDVAFDTT